MGSAPTPKGEKLFRCGSQLIKTSIDVCRLANIQSEIFGKIIMENLHLSSNFALECPLMPGEYKLTNFRYLNGKLIDNSLDNSITFTISAYHKTI